MQLRKLLTIVCEALKLDFGLVRSNSRKRELVWARNIFMVIARREYGFSTTQIGFFLGRDHSTVVHSTERHDSSLTTKDIPYILWYKKAYNHVMREAKGIEFDNNTILEALRALALNIIAHKGIDSIDLPLKQKRLIYEDLCLQPVG